MNSVSSNESTVRNLRKPRKLSRIAVHAFPQTTLGKRGSPIGEQPVFGSIGFMLTSDDFSTYVADLLCGTYDCVDRISVRGYFPLGQTSGGLLTWWNDLFPNTLLTQQRLRTLAGDFARRVHAYARKHKIALRYFAIGDKTKHAQAEKLRPVDPKFRGVFAIFVAKAPALVWQAKNNRDGKVVLRRPKNWPLVYHYHFHIVDPQWGHLTIKVSGHPPFGLQISLNGHEWVKRQAQKQAISWVKEGNCFVGGSDLAGLNGLAEQLDGARGLARLAQVVDRWVYSACLCVARNREQQQRSGFRYAYSCYQLEYSRNLLFKSGRQLDEVYQGLIDRTRRLLDVPRLKTIFGRKQRPSKTQARDGRLEKIIERSVYDLTVFKVHFGKLTLKMYDKGDRVLRVEIIVNNIEELRCGKRLEKLPGMLQRLQEMVVAFLGIVQAAHLSFVDGQQFGCFGRAECAGHATDGGRGPAKAADASGGRSGDRAGRPARRVQCCRPGGASAGAERTSDGELCSPKSGLRLAQAAGQVAGGADRQNAVLSNAPTRHPHAGGTADPARAGDQTGIGRSL